MPEKPMASQRWASIIGPATEKDRVQRDAISRRCAELIEQGICPSCRQFKTGDVFPNSAAYTYYEDDKVVALLESYPRGTGHTVT
jgi:histidine triad (HIT) family protein